MRPLFVQYIYYYKTIVLLTRVAPKILSAHILCKSWSTVRRIRMPSYSDRHLVNKPIGVGSHFVPTSNVKSVILVCSKMNAIIHVLSFN